MQDLINKIIHDDCFNIFPKICDKSIDLILSDLPYGVTTRNKWDSILPLDLLWKEYSRILKDNGVIVLTSQGMFSAQLMMTATVKYKYSMVWRKQNVTNYLNAHKQPLRKHEDILVFYNNQPAYNPQGLRRKMSVTRMGKTSTTNYGEQKRDSYFQEYTHYPNTIINVKTATTRRHPTEKPVNLFEYLIKTFTNKEMLVLDNCSGSGTTAIAARKSKRNFICIEKEQTYCDTAQKRLEEFNLNNKELKLFDINKVPNINNSISSLFSINKVIGFLSNFLNKYIIN